VALEKNRWKPKVFCCFLAVWWLYQVVKRYRWVMFVCFLAISGWIGYWLARTAVPQREAAEVIGKPAGEVSRVVIDDEVRFRSGERAPGFRSDDEALMAGALVGQGVGAGSPR